MRKVLISNLQPGMILGKKVYSPNGNILLTSGTELNPTYSKKLQALGFSAVFVQENYSSDLVFPEIVPEKIRIDAGIILRRVFEEAKRCRKIDTAVVKSLVNSLVDEIIRNRQGLIEIPDIRSYDGYIYGHSVNVCIMALQVGLLLDYNELQLRDLGVGAILHDIGVVFIDKEVIEKVGRFTDDEFVKMKQHSVEGFNLLREQKDLNLLSAHVAFQHHERIDGTGYPRLLKSDEICEYARITAIADLFDALTTERKYRKSYPFYAAIDLMKENVGQKTDRDLTRLFFRNIAAYPTGSLVELNTGEIGLVISNSRPDTSRPVIRIVTDKLKRITVTEVLPEIDLCKERESYIINVIEQDEPVADDLRSLYNGFCQQKCITR